VIHARENITSQFAAEIVLAASTTALQKECARPVLARPAWYFGQGLVHESTMSASVRDHFGVIGRHINGAVRRKRRRRLRARSDDHLEQDFSIRRDGLRRFQR
jgi:hypothetical protein